MRENDDIVTLKILMKTDDCFSAKGFESVIEELCEIPIVFNDVKAFLPQDITSYDVIIFHLPPGGELVCNPLILEMYKRKVFVFYLDISLGSVRYIPECMKDYIFITRYDDLNTIRTKLLNFKNIKDKNEGSEVCYKCRHEQLSTQQKIVANHLNCGVKPSDISMKMSINTKTVYSHKNQIKRKFNLKTDIDLIKLLKWMGDFAE